MPNKSTISPGRSRKTRRGFGFSIIEIMVAIVIIVSLASILIVTFTGVDDAAKALAAKQTMASIKMALNAYNTDFGDYPPSRIFPRANAKTFGVFDDDMAVGSNPQDYQGAELLAMALIGPSRAEKPANLPTFDGKDGYGWKGSSRKVDKVYGPYLTLSSDDMLVPRWDINNDKSTDGEYANTIGGEWNNSDDDNISSKRGAYVLTTPGSRFNRPILYYHPNSPRGLSDPAADFHDDALNSSTPIWGDTGGDTSPSPKPRPRFDLAHNRDGLLMRLDHNDMDGEDEIENPAEFWYAIGNSQPSGDLGVVHPQWLERRQQLERTLRSANFLLVSAGPDDFFGVVDEYKKGLDGIDQLKETDDVIVTGP